MKKILCATDFSEGASRAVHAAAQLAVDHGAELILAHVWHVPALALVGEASFPANTLQRLRDDSVAALERARRDALAVGVSRGVTTTILDGAPGPEIAKLAHRDEAIELVVVGTHGRTGIARLLLGSVAEYVVRHAPCSTLAVRSELGRFSHLLCSVDFSPISETAVELARALAVRRACDLTLVHVVDLPASYQADSTLVEYFATIDVLGTQMLDKIAAPLREVAGLRVTTRLEVGSPVGRILAVLGERSYDLVVVGSHGHAGLARVLLGSVAERIVRHASCSVLVARKRPRDLPLFA